MHQIATVPQRRRLLVHATLAVLAAATGIGCSAGGGSPSGGSDGPALLATDQEASVAFQLSTWTAWTMPVPICFIRDTSDPTTTLSVADFNTLTATAFATVQTMWGRVPTVRFVRGCTAARRINFQTYAGGYGGQCGPSGSCQLHLTPATDPDPAVNADTLRANDWGVVHEVGHGLGLVHEHQRPDLSQPDCALAADRLSAEQRCLQAYNSGLSCTAADYNLIFGASVTASRRVTADEATAIRNDMTNLAPDTNAYLLTRYDPLSIMSYCAGFLGRDPGDPNPTALDLLGAEMLYPPSGTYPLGCSSGCFTTGSGVIVRSDGVVTSNWTSRGAVNVRMSLTDTPGSTTLPASSFADGSSSPTYRFWDPRGTRHTSASSVVKSNSAFTSIVNANASALL